MDPVKQSLISVIMPAYNTEKYIAEAIESILEQTYPHFELLICDDGSTDGTLDIVKKYAAKDPRIRYFINKKNIGNLKTTNFLFDQCQGKYIAIQDADDISLSNRFQKALLYLTKNSDVSLIGTNYISTDDVLNPIFCSLLPITHDIITKNIDREVPPILYGSILFKKDLLNEIGKFHSIFDRKGFADLDWLYRVSEKKKVANLSEHLYLYRQNGNPSEKYPHKTHIEKYGLQLLTEAHRRRKLNLSDPLEEKRFFEIRRFIGSLLRRRADHFFLLKDYRQSKTAFLQSLRIYPLDLYVIKMTLKLIFKKTK